MELTQLHALADADRLDRALSLWTLKEAYIKARGVGLSLSLNQVSLLYGGPEGIRLELDPRLADKVEHWRFCHLELAGHRIAVMARGVAAFDLQLTEIQSLQPTASRLSDAPENWFPLLP
jgi:4'-phosphopantetheinyl transferase